ncbi:MAG: hypothetical protein WA395_03660 [Nitrososphaeraceae archaeon]|jgi:hypothetical protein
MIDYAPPPSQSQQDDVKIRLKRGEWEIEITCGKDKIKAVIEDVLFGIDISTEANNGLATKVEELRAEIASLKSRVMAIPETHGPGPDNLVRPKVVMSAGATCRGLIELLCHEGYFELEKTLGQVHEELSRRGYNYDRTAVSHSLTDLVREGNLRRIGTIRNYRYLQKGKPTYTGENLKAVT